MHESYPYLHNQRSLIHHLIIFCNSFEKNNFPTSSPINPLLSFIFPMLCNAMQRNAEPEKCKCVRKCCEKCKKFRCMFFLPIYPSMYPSFSFSFIFFLVIFPFRSCSSLPASRFPLLTLHSPLSALHSPLPTPHSPHPSIPQTHQTTTFTVIGRLILNPLNFSSTLLNTSGSGSGTTFRGIAIIHISHLTCLHLVHSCMLIFESEEEW